MVRMGLVGGGVLVWLVAAGCAPAGQRRDPQFELTKVQREREDLARRLADEQARAAALQKRIEAEEADWRATRAENDALRARDADLKNQADALQARIAERAARPPERPAISASPLPPAVDTALQGLAQRYADRVWYDRARGAISFANDRLFAPGSDELRADARPPLEELAGVLVTMPAELDVVVVGHTDPSAITKPETLAKHPSNWHLSVHRALAVQDVLLKAGVPPTRCGAMGYGEHRPVSTDPVRNRRVEVFIVRRGAVESLEPVRPARR